MKVQRRKRFKRVRPQIDDESDGEDQNDNGEIQRERIAERIFDSEDVSTEGVIPILNHYGWRILSVTIYIIPNCGLCNSPHVYTLFFFARSPPRTNCPINIHTKLSRRPQQLQQHHRLIAWPRSYNITLTHKPKYRRRLCHRR